jgi:hypothetical protein
MFQRHGTRHIIPNESQIKGVIADLMKKEKLKKN